MVTVAERGKFKCKDPEVVINSLYLRNISYTSISEELSAKGV